MKHLYGFMENSRSNLKRATDDLIIGVYADPIGRMSYSERLETTLHTLREETPTIVVDVACDLDQLTWISQSLDGLLLPDRWSFKEDDFRIHVQTDRRCDTLWIGNEHGGKDVTLECSWYLTRELTDETIGVLMQAHRLRS
jgi:hypothetical protein